jgi:hypothetical protein
MDYIIEDDFDFYASLKQNNNEVIAIPDKQCLISHEALTYNAITLPCNHSFNYIPLYTELCLHKKTKLTCPYCRTMHDKLLPFIPLPNVLKISGINYPTKMCLAGNPCQWKMTTGVNKGKSCGKNGIEDATGTYCEKHKEKMNIANAPPVAAPVIIWTSAMDKLYKSKTIIQLKEMLSEKKLKTTGTKKILVERLFNKI